MNSEFFIASQLKQKMHRYFNSILKNSNISSMHVRLLLFLKREGISKLTTLTAVLGCDKANTTRLVNKLEKNGYVVKKNDEQNHFIVDLKPKGNKLAAKLEEEFVKWNKAVTKDIDLKELIVFKKIMAKMLKNAEEYLEGENFV